MHWMLDTIKINQKIFTPSAKNLEISPFFLGEFMILNVDARTNVDKAKNDFLKGLSESFILFVSRFVHYIIALSKD